MNRCFFVFGAGIGGGSDDHRSNCTEHKHTFHVMEISNFEFMPVKVVSSYSTRVLWRLVQNEDLYSASDGYQCTKCTSQTWYYNRGSISRLNAG